MAEAWPGYASDMIPRTQMDWLAPSPVVFEPVALGAGQVPSPFCEFLHTTDAGFDNGTDVRRAPNSAPKFISSWPERW